VYCIVFIIFSNIIENELISGVIPCDENILRNKDIKNIAEIQNDLFIFFIPLHPKYFHYSFVFYASFIIY